MSISRNEIEEKGWTSISNLMDLMEDVLLKFADQTNVSPEEMKNTIEAKLKMSIDKAWEIKSRKADVYMRKM